MREIITWVIVSAFISISFVGFVLTALAKRKKGLAFSSIVFFILAIVSWSWTAYLFSIKSYREVAQMTKPRTSEEIYEALFEKRPDCVKIINYTDQFIPKIDYAIWLYFETCPEELGRIIQLNNFSFQRQATKGLRINGPSANEKWFKPESLGDSILVFEYAKDSLGNGQTIYSSLDSTKVFLIDVLD